MFIKANNEDLQYWYRVTIFSDSKFNFQLI